MSEMKAKLSAEVVARVRALHTKVEAALVAPEDEKLPLVLDALEAAVAAMDAMTDRMLVDVLGGPKS